MALWSNTDANTSAPIFTPAQVNLAPTEANRDLLYANTTADAFVTGETIGLFGVSADETVGTGNVGSLTIVTAGSGFTARPTILITGANTTQATATANGTLVAAAIHTPGTGYEVDDTFTTNGTPTVGVVTVTSVDANGNVTGIAITTAGNFSTLPTLSQYAFASNTTVAGTGFAANLSIGVGSTTITNAGEEYNKDTVGVTIGGAGGTGAVIAIALTGQDATNKGAHAGWVLRTVGSGGRAGRVQMETLVAMGSMTGDGADDSVVAP